MSFLLTTLTCGNLTLSLARQKRRLHDSQFFQLIFTCVSFTVTVIC